MTADHRSRPPLLLVVCLALLAAACTGDADDSTDVAAPDAATEGDVAPAGETEAEAEGEAPGTSGDAVVALAGTDLGEVLVDADGLTLYGFTNDTDGTSSCYDDCASNWPPVVVEDGFSVGEGLDEATFTTTERDDGSLQLVAGDWPLYRFAGDTAAGDVNGQGVGDIWFAVTADGALVEGAVQSSQTGSGAEY